MPVFFASAYLLCMTLIMLFSLVQLHITLFAKMYHKRHVNSYKTSSKETRQPFVTIQLPVFNEKYVIERFLKATVEIDYPKELFEIQVLDDSTDETSTIAADYIKKLNQIGFNASHIQRNNREGYKAGALANGLGSAKGEFIAIFDADFIPDPDFLKDLLPHFDDPSIGMVQSKWAHINEKFSLLTRIQAFGLNAHFSVEQAGRNTAGSYINFNGTGGIWRTACIIDSGNWANDTLAEDLDLSYRAQIRGWKFKYLEEVETPAELPVSLAAIRSQQFRWSKGGAQAARRNIGSVVKHNFPLINKIHAIFHLSNSLVFPLLLFAAIFSVPMLVIKQNLPEYNLYFNLGSIFLTGFIAISIFYWVSAKINHPDNTLGYYLWHYPVFLSITMGLSFQNSIAVILGFANKASEFVRTPKFGISKKYDLKGIRKTIHLSWKNLFELILFLYFIYGVVFGLKNGDYGLIIFHLMLALGFATVLFYSLIPTLQYGKSTE